MERQRTWLGGSWLVKVTRATLQCQQRPWKGGPARVWETFQKQHIQDWIIISQRKLHLISLQPSSTHGTSSPAAHPGPVIQLQPLRFPHSSWNFQVHQLPPQYPVALIPPPGKVLIFFKALHKCHLIENLSSTTPVPFSNVYFCSLHQSSDILLYVYLVIICLPL